MARRPAAIATAPTKTPPPAPRGLRVHTPVLVRAQDLNPSAYNPNVLPPERYYALKMAIREDGFLEPLVVQKVGMNIIGGHHRLKAIREICGEDGVKPPRVPCVVVDVTDAEAKKINLKLNIHGEPDAKLLGEVLADIFPANHVIDDADVARLGLDADDVSRYIRLVEPERFPSTPPEGPVEGFARSVTLSLQFDSVKERDRVKEILQHRADVEKKKSGEIVAEILSSASERRRGRK